MVENFTQDWNFKSLNPDDEISSRMLSDNNSRIKIIGKNFITINQTEISAWFEQTELKFSLHVNELKILLYRKYPNLVRTKK